MSRIIGLYTPPHPVSSFFCFALLPLPAAAARGLSVLLSY
jgi:hypothetical protein